MNPKFSVLIIEDETHILNFMRKILTSHDYKVLSANTGKAGLEIISSQCPDIILLDLGLPDIDGVDIIKKVESGRAARSSLFPQEPLNGKRCLHWILVQMTISPNLLVLPNCLQGSVPPYVTAIR